MESILRTSDDDAFMASIVEENAFIDPRTYNARLLQCRHSIKTLTEELTRALSAGEPETSPYVARLVTRINTLITQEAELSALAGEEGRSVA